MTEKKRVVVLGGSWFIGRAIVEALLRRKYYVITVNRKVSSVTYLGHVERLAADRQNISEYLEVLNGIDTSYVIDVTAYRAIDTFTVANSFRNRIKKAVHISTLSVYRWPFPCPISEDWPLEKDSSNKYGFHKAECERVLFLESTKHFPWTIIRLPYVYGPGDQISREHFFFTKAIKGEVVFIPEKPFLCQNVFIDDVANACCTLLENPNASGRVYNIGSSIFTLENYLDLFSSIIQKTFYVRKIGINYLKDNCIDINKIPYFFNDNLVLKTDRFADEIRYNSSTNLKQGLLKTLSWIKTNPKIANHWDLEVKK